MLEPDPQMRVRGVGQRTPLVEPGQHTLQILMTEHWSLLVSRSLGYTESVSRTSIWYCSALEPLFPRPRDGDA